MMPHSKSELFEVEVRKPGQEYISKDDEPKISLKSIMDMCFIDFYKHVSEIHNNNG